MVERKHGARKGVWEYRYGAHELQQEQARAHAPGQENTDDDTGCACIDRVAPEYLGTRTRSARTREPESGCQSAHAIKPPDPVQ